MIVYKLTVTCPYYGDTDLIGIYSSMDNINIAKKIICRNIMIDNYNDRFHVTAIEIDNFPYDNEAGLWEDVE